MQCGLLFPVLRDSKMERILNTAFPPGRVTYNTRKEVNPENVSSGMAVIRFSCKYLTKIEKNIF